MESLLPTIRPPADAFDPRTKKIPSQRQMDKADALLQKEVAK